jgi:hypothetical protein
MSFQNVTEAKAAINEALRTDVARYIWQLDHESPIISRSHLLLRGLYKSYGKETTDAEVDRQFAHREHDAKVTCGNCGNSWCETCDPAPSALCHTCHGRGYSIAPITEEG